MWNMNTCLSQQNRSPKAEQNGTESGIDGQTSKRTIEFENMLDLARSYEQIKIKNTDFLPKAIGQLLGTFDFSILRHLGFMT